MIEALISDIFKFRAVATFEPLPTHANPLFREVPSLELKVLQSVELRYPLVDVVARDRSMD